MLNNDGQIALYNFEHYFDEEGNFTLGPDSVTINSDGSVTIKKEKDLYIYETQVDGGVDYSLEFKNFYVVEDDQLYSIQGGYINVPSVYKSLDSNGDLVISADYFNDYNGDMVRDGDSLIITPDAYSLATKTIQPQAAMTVVGVGTGEVKAMVGGRSFKGQKLLNRALNARQPGSSIKPLSVYGCALQKSFELEAKGQKWTYTDFDIDEQGAKGWGDYVTVHTSIEDEVTHIDGKDWPENVTKSYSGANTFKTAIQQSINTCAVKILWQVGLDYSVETLKNFGITTVVDDVSNPVNDVNPAALGLGAMTEGVTPLEMALAYAAFPNGGVRNEAVCYTRVVDSKDKELLTGGYKEHKVLDSGVAWIMTDLLKSVVSDGIAGNARISGVEVGGKTGTTNDKYDVWFDGFTPDYAAALWIGTDLNVEMDGGSYQAARLWSRIMKQVPGITDGEYREMPANVVEKDGEYYTKGTEENLSEYIDYDDDDDDSGSDEDADEAKRKAAEEAAKKKAEEDAAKKAAHVIDERALRPEDREEKDYYLSSYDNFYNDIFGENGQNAEESILELQFKTDGLSNPALYQMYYGFRNSNSGYGYMKTTKYYGDSNASSDPNSKSVFKSSTDQRIYEYCYDANDGIDEHAVRKFVGKATAGDGVSQDATKGSISYQQNWILYRLTDVMLMKAEALVQLDEFDEAFKLAEFVNARAISSGTSYLHKSTNKNTMESLILLERARELCFEGKRYFDLLRYNFRHMDGIQYDKLLSEQSAFPANSEDFLGWVLAKYNDATAMKSKLPDERFLYMPLKISC